MMKKKISSDATKKVLNRFLIINIVSKRVHQLKKDNNIVENHNISLEDRAFEELRNGKLKINFKEKTKNQEGKK